MISPDIVKKILVIRRDNIGDLVCTTPLFEVLKSQFPSAAIHALVNSYNAAVLEGNPHVAKTHVYEKLKHRERLWDIPGAIVRRVRLLLELRREHFDFAIIAGSGFQPRVLNYLRTIRPRHIVGYTDSSGSEKIDFAVPAETAQGIHEVNAVMNLLKPLGIHDTPPPVNVYSRGNASQPTHERLRVGVHISSRKPSQRWPTESFIEFIRFLRQQYDAEVFLYWSPGSQSDSRHPGDDEKADVIVRSLQDAAVIPVPTTALRALIEHLALTDIVVCSDGGAMHIAAGLGKPILCFFGDSDAAKWHPWGVPFELIQHDSRLASDIGTGEAIEAFKKLLDKRS
jgi:heptosyltransferase III